MKPTNKMSVFEIEIGYPGKRVVKDVGITQHYNIETLKSFKTLSEARAYTKTFGFTSALSKYEKPSAYIVENPNPFITSRPERKKTLEFIC